MRKYADWFLRKLTTAMEYFISLMLAVAIILISLKLALGLVNIPNLEVYPNYEDLLASCLNLIIGVELIRMIYEHIPSTIFEVLLFAISRQIIMEHSSAVNSLIGVIAIAALFATRKFLFCQFDEAEKIIFRATQRVGLVNKLIHIQLPGESTDTLEKTILDGLEKSGDEVGVGACVYYSDCGLRIAKMHGGKISRIEVIRSIH